MTIRSRATVAASLPAVLLAAVLVGCRPPDGSTLDNAHAAALRDSVTQAANALAVDLAQEGPNAWLGYFEESTSFFMASDGVLRFPTIDSAITFVRAFAPTYTSLRLEWDDLRVEPLGAGVAVMATPYRETLVDTTGAELSLGGYVTAVWSHTAEGWRIRNLHWSSPVPGE